MVSFASLKRKIQYLSQGSMKWILPLLLFIVGFAVSFLSFLALRFTIGGDLLTLANGLFSIYLLIFVSGFVLVFVVFVRLAVRLYDPFRKLHDSFRRLIEHALEVREVRTVVLARIPVSIVLNLAYFTVLFFVPLSILAETVPFGKLIQNFVPSYTLPDIFASPLVVLFILYFGSGAPATVYLIRYLRVQRCQHDIGGRTVTLLQLLCYISWLVLAFFFGAHIGFDPDKAHLFLYYFSVFAVPATFANLVAFSLVIFMQESKYIS